MRQYATVNRTLLAEGGSQMPINLRDAKYRRLTFASKVREAGDSNTGNYIYDMIIGSLRGIPVSSPS